MEVDKNQNKNLFSIEFLKLQHLIINSIERPKPRSGHRLISDSQGNLYSFGGYNSELIDDASLENDNDWQLTRPLFQELWKYNVSTGCWKKIKTSGPHPKQLASHCAEMLNDHTIFVFGGTAVPFERYTSNSIHVCNLKKKKWTLVDPKCSKQSKFPSKNYGQALCVDSENQKIYVSGGTNGFFFVMDVHCFDYKEKLWTQLGSSFNDYPVARYRHETTLFKNQLYVFGGGSSETVLSLDILPVFDLETKSWSQCETRGHQDSNKIIFPCSRKCHSCVRYKDYIFLLGGLFKKKICQDLWRFDLNTKQWTLLIENLSIPVYFHGATISNYGQLSVFGGLTIKGKTHSRTDKLFSVWVDVPPLKEYAWRALLYHNNYFKNKTDAELIKLGIPNYYISRLVL